ncbi:heavy-metal-associated domain-containing protein [Planctomicrobium sp. SH668]|uniref:heavy-metal-associated domain-containing protein n=1 Tax=Planctomicrobium sp. SH668 TaxID=3448126 RepID=UPI003F5C32CF
MNVFKFAGVTAACLVLTATQCLAAEVKVEGVHLCCGGCVKAATAALSKVDGVTNPTVDQDGGTVAFEASDDAAAARGLTALADTGLYGKTETTGPEFKIKADAVKNEVKITKVHACCGGCVDAIESALKKVTGVKSVETTQSKKGEFALKGEKINLSETLRALHEAGFHGKVE